MLAVTIIWNDTNISAVLVVRNINSFYSNGLIHLKKAPFRTELIAHNQSTGVNSIYGNYLSHFFDKNLVKAMVLLKKFEIGIFSAVIPNAHSAEISQIYSHLTLFGKNFVKATHLLNKILKS